MGLLSEAVQVVSHAVGSENHKHSLQTGDQEEGSKQRTAHRPQDTQTKGFSTLLLGVSSGTSLQSFKVSLLAPKKNCDVL